VHELKHQRSLVESELNKLKERRRKESTKYSREEEQRPLLQPTLSEKLLQTLSKDEEASDGILKVVIEYLDVATSPALISVNPLSRWMKFIKIGFYVLVVLMVMGLSAWLYSLYVMHKQQQIDIVNIVMDAVVSVYPKLNITDSEL